MTLQGGIREMKRLLDIMVLLVVLAARMAWAADDAMPSRLTPPAEPVVLRVGTFSAEPQTSLRLLNYETEVAPTDDIRLHLLPAEVNDALPIEGQAPSADPRSSDPVALPTTIDVGPTDRFRSTDSPPCDADDPGLFEVGGYFSGFSTTGPTAPRSLAQESVPNAAASQFLRSRSVTGQPSRGYDVQQILALLEPDEVESTQSPPRIPRALPPPDVALPPDPSYDDLQMPPRAAPRYDEFQDDRAPHAPPRPVGEFDRFGAQAYSPAMSPQTGPFQPPETHWPYYLGTDGRPDRSRQLLSNRSRALDGGYPRESYCPPCNAPGRPEPRRLLTPSCLASRDFTFGGWLDQGITLNAADPVDRYNGPVTFNDRDGDYQMNQLYLVLQRETDTRGGGFDLGGRIDFLYGTDARFTQADDGLEAAWDQQRRFYQAALPQFYLDAAYNDWKVRLGHFYSPMGFETVPAPDNFFYSHSYAFQYGWPRTFTGMLATRTLGRGLSLSGGFTRGNNQFDDTDGLDQLGFLGGIDWTSPNRRLDVDFNISSGEQGLGNNTVIYSLVGQLHLTTRLRWVLENTYGQSAGGGLQDVRMAEWYGISNYVLYELRRNLSVGARIEWFRDEQGAVVHGLGDGNLATGPYPGSFQEITLGLNWQPRRNMLLRPEVRWDWYDGDSPAGHKPFDGGHRNGQFLTALDVIVQF